MEITDRVKDSIKIKEEITKEFGQSGQVSICPYSLPKEKMAKQLLEFLKKKEIFIKYLVDIDSQDPKAFILRRLGTKDTVDGETWDAYFPIAMGEDVEGKVHIGAPGDRPYYFIAYKLVPLTKKDILLQYNIKQNVWRELYILQEMTDRLLNKNGPPSLPVEYSHFICPKASDIWHNPSIKREVKSSNPILEYGQQALIILNEREDYDLGHWVKNVLPKLDNPDEQVRTLIWSIFATMTYLQIHMKFVHLDFHLGNVLVRENRTSKKDNKQESTPSIPYWVFKFHNQTYYLPNRGYTFIIWDFYRSLLLDVDNPGEIVKRLLPEMGFIFGRTLLVPIRPKIAINIKNNPKTYLPYVYAYDSYRFLTSILNTVKRLNLPVRLGTYYAMMFDAKQAIIEDLPKKKLPAIRPALSKYPFGSPAYLFEKYLTGKEFKSKKERVPSTILNPEPYVLD